ncbi:MAG TPA: hypothetical protein VK422_05355 [Pyrinomonadaceae bacterium]|nr:hypothetical protein [Pyrinomonadaceae bacterium]
MLKAFILSTLLLLVNLPAALGQEARKTPAAADVEQHAALLNELRWLADESAELAAPLARAAARVEIAAAVWPLDPEAAKELLRDAYRLTTEKEGREPGGARAAASESSWASAEGRARLDVRLRVLAVASRDESLADELLRQDGAESEGGDLYGRLAQTALGGGDAEGAVRFVEKSLGLDPARGAAPGVINELARRDRAAADRLILKYIEGLRRLPLSGRDGSAAVLHLTFVELLQPNSFFGDPNGQTPRPGPAVMRAYAAFVVESLGRMERSEPGSVKYMRGMLMSAWLPLKQHAPELAGAFHELEARSRIPGRDSSLPTPDSERAGRERAEKRRHAAAEADDPDDRSINSLIGNGEYDRARKAIDKLPDGPRKAQHTEKANLNEALGLAAKGDVTAASLLAERLTRAAPLVQVYTALIKVCAAKKDAACVSSLGLRAMRQLEKADAAPFAPPAGVPSSFFATGRESDAALQGLGRLAAAVAPFDAPLAFEMFDRMVAAANRSGVDTGLGRVGYDHAAFASLAALDETRARQAASALEDRLRRITALATILKWKAEALGTADGRRPPEAAVQ